MTRVLHTKADIAEEDSVAEKLSECWSCVFSRYPQMFVLDWWISSGSTLKAFAEMKRRYNNHDKYPTVYLSFAKWAALLDYSTRAGVDGLIIYAFDDGIWYAKARQIDGSGVRILGRYDRRDVPTDLEPIIEVPIAMLTKVDLPKNKTNEEWQDEFSKACANQN